MLKPIESSDIIIGKPLEQDLYDNNGQLLLTKGSVLSSSNSKHKIVERGHKFITQHQADKKPSSPNVVIEDSVFSVVQLAAPSLDIITNDFITGRYLDTFENRIQSLASRLIKACQQDPEAAIAAIHLYHESEYNIRHHLSVGVVTALLAEAEGSLPATDVHQLVCAALTHDIAILHLTNDNSHLNAQQKALVRQHPELSSAALYMSNIRNSIWLTAVLQHHERLDGTGYPHALSGSAISIEGKILAVADVYCAMTRPRPYRPKAYFPMAAMRDLYTTQSQQLDHGLIQLLIKTLGLIPPGTLVKLKNGETAVVKKRSTQATPLCYTLLNSSGAPVMPPERRDTKESNQSIAGRVDYENCLHAQALIRSLWK